MNQIERALVNELKQHNLKAADSSSSSFRFDFDFEPADGEGEGERSGSNNNNSSSQKKKNKKKKKKKTKQKDNAGQADLGDHDGISDGSDSGDEESTPVSIATVTGKAGAGAAAGAESSKQAASSIKTVAIDTSKPETPSNKDSSSSSSSSAKPNQPGKKQSNNTSTAAKIDPPKKGNSNKSGKKGKQKDIKGGGGDSDDDLRMIEAAIAEVQVGLLQQQRQQTSKLRFVSYKDPEVDEETRQRLRYGNGKNLVAIGPRKVRDQNKWLQSTLAASETTSDVLSATVSNNEGSSQSSFHTSPFSFGFEDFSKSQW